jgi:4-hydroxybenzoate polyprenyltransferase
LNLLEPQEESLLTDEPPLVVDLDGTLLRSDLLVETGISYLRDQPHRVGRLCLWLSQGKAKLKRELAQGSDIDVAVLPYNLDVVRLIEAERKRGRKIVLATASHRILAERVVHHLSLFDVVMATEGDQNLSAHAKRAALVAAFGEQGFDYAGNSSDDLPVWASARLAYVVDAPLSVERQAQELGRVAAVMRSPRSGLKVWARALRLHQWLKNLLIFVPLLAAHRYDALPMVIDAALAFFCYGLCASSVYILNDLLDLPEDRQHIRKRNRPFASGQLSVLSGLAVFPVLLVTAFLLAIWLLPGLFVSVLFTYYILTLFYSLVIKRRMVIDVITLAGLYSLRIVAGVAAIGVSLSFWLLAFSMFIFLSLALVKRYAELFQVRAQGRSDKVHGRGYYADDLGMIASLGASAGYMSVLVLAFYINDPATTRLYQHPEVIWLACPLLLTWISRVWMLAHRGHMNDDPVVFAVRDRISLSIGLLLALVFWAAA